MCAWCRTGCGRSSRTWCRSRRYAPKVEAGGGAIVARCWPRSSSSLPRAAPRGRCHRSSGLPGRPSIDASPSGPRPGSGPSCTARPARDRHLAPDSLGGELATRCPWVSRRRVRGWPTCARGRWTGSAAHCHVSGQEHRSALPGIATAIRLGLRLPVLRAAPTACAGDGRDPVASLHAEARGASDPSHPLSPGRELATTAES